jgi:hypothetical protein
LFGRHWPIKNCQSLRDYFNFQLVSYSSALFTLQLLNTLKRNKTVCRVYRGHTVFPWAESPEEKILSACPAKSSEGVPLRGI